MVYLDAAATTLRKPEAVSRAMVEALAQCGNPGRSGHAAARQADETLLHCRELAGALFDTPAEQVVLTMNATHGLNLAIYSLVHPGARVVVSGFEHNAVMWPLHALRARITVAGRRLFDPGEALDRWEQALRTRPRAAVCTHVSNVFGYILPIEEIAALCRQYQVPLIVDASQSAGTLPVSLRRWDCAYIAMPGHKGLYGPQGTGLLLCGQIPRPLLCGGTGSQSRSYAMPEELPDRVEAGTPNLPGVAGLCEGLKFIREHPSLLAHERELLRCFRHRWGRELPFWGGGQQAGVLSLRLPADCEEVGQALADRDIAVRAGLHCAPLAHKSAGTLESGTIRLSPDAFTTCEEMKIAADCLKEIMNNLSNLKFHGDLPCLS